MRGVAAAAREVRARLRVRLGPAPKPETVPSLVSSQLARMRDHRPPLHVLHVGKTGGTALTEVLLEHLEEANHRLLLHGHDVALSHVPRGEPFAFILRNPISRFVSAFMGRLRADHPRYHYPWRDEERVAFAIFETPEQLASALSSADGDERATAERAMRGIAHLNTPYRYWFGDVKTLRSRLSDVFFVAFQERLDDDFELLKRKLGLPEHARLPRDPIAAHRSLAPAPEPLSERARANLERWYAADFELLEFCRRLAPLVNSDELPRENHPPSPLPAPHLRRPRIVPLRYLVAPLVGVVTFAATATLVETFTDRDWRLSGFEWPADFLTAALLVCLVPIVLAGLSGLGTLRRRVSGAGRGSTRNARSAAD